MSDTLPENWDFLLRLERLEEIETGRIELSQKNLVALKQLKQMVMAKLQNEHRPPSPSDTQCIMSRNQAEYHEALDKVKQSRYCNRIVNILDKSPVRMEHGAIMKEMEKRGEHLHDQTLKKYLKVLRLSNVVDNRHDCDPAGYGLLSKKYGPDGVNNDGVVKQQ